MAKGSGSGKSSATSGTRKKHAKKAAGSVEPPETGPGKEKRAKNKEKGKGKKEPRQRVYIPPVKPAPVQPDPLETTGIAHQLPPELLVVLRSLGKKAVVTKGHALEDLQSEWVEKALAGDEELMPTLHVMFPVWMHHVSALFLHPSRRIRQLTADLHKSFVLLMGEAILAHFHTCSTREAEWILGSWCVAAHDIDRGVAASALSSWQSFNALLGDDLLLNDKESGLFSCLVTFVHRAAMDPLAVYLDLNPPPPPAPPPPPPTKGASRKVEPESTPRFKSEDLKEDEQDRKARIRVGAYGAIRWIIDNVKTEFHGQLSSLVFWSGLHCRESAPFVPADEECFGYGQPAVRKAAWALVQALLRHPIQTQLSTLSAAILHSAWVESDTTVHTVMWQPLLRFLKDHPNAWELADSPRLEEDGSSDEEDEEQHPPLKGRPSYDEFLQFLQLGCSGSPIQGYPTVVIIISTIPSSIFASTSSSSPLADFFTSFWAAIDGRALRGLNRTKASGAFLESLYECMVFLLRRVHRDAGHASLLLGTETKMDELVGDQVVRTFKALEDRTLKVEEEKLCDTVSETLVSLEAIDNDLFRSTWSVFSQIMKNSGSPFVPCLLKTLLDRLPDDSELYTSSHVLLQEILRSAIGDWEHSFNEPSEDHQLGNGVHTLVGMLNIFGQRLFSDDLEFASKLDGLVSKHAYLTLTRSEPLFFAYLSHRKDEALRYTVWHNTLDDIGQHWDTLPSSLKRLLDARVDINMAGTQLDTQVHQLFVESVHKPSGSPEVSLMQQVLQKPGLILSKNGFDSLIQTLGSVFMADINVLLRSENESHGSVDTLLVLISTALFSLPRFTNSPSLLAIDALPYVFLLGYVLPRSVSSLDGTAAAQALWDRFIQERDLNHFDETAIFSGIQDLLKTIVVDTQMRPSPEHVLQALSEATLKEVIAPLSCLLSEPELDEMLDEMSSDPIHPSLAVLDPLIPPGQYGETGFPECDSRGFSPYARLVSMLLFVFMEDRQSARRNTWALRHLIALSLYAEDYSACPVWSSPAFGTEALMDLEGLIVKLQQICTYLLTSASDDGWRLKVLDVLTNGRPLDEAGPPLAVFLRDQIVRAREGDEMREARILGRVLSHVLHDADKAEADRWIAFARSIDRTAPETSMAIVRAVVEVAPEPPRLDRYRNELAASLMGVPPAKANADGLITLRKLAASAPHADSEVVYLPQQRALNVVKTCEKWIASDEDLDEEVQSAMTWTFCHLAPILQNLEGSHWQFIFDVVENNLDNSSFDDDDTFVSLAQTLRLILVIKDLALTNKVLREDWRSRRLPILKMVRDLASSRLDGRASVPRSRCLELVLAVVQDLPADLIDHNTLPKMCHLVMDTGTEVQKKAYMLLQQAAYKRTEHMVVEAAVDGENTFKAELPRELVSILQQSLNFDDANSAERPNNVFGYLLGWMIVFDLFFGSSLKVKASYIDQLRSLDIIAGSFMPMVLSTLNLDQGAAKVYKLDLWAVDEYHIELYEPDEAFTLQVLAAYLYYRALLNVPSLIHSWILDCKDRQLSSTIVSYTSAHFSPAIIRTELVHVKSSEAATELEDDTFKIKVAPNVNEVVASYLVDEHQLEMKLRIPTDWPLHKIEVKDMKRIGVDEKRWRAWMLGVQQTIWASDMLNGRIVDGLGLFKKNVTLHFEGQVECAICYSIISVMDGTLPQRPCRTCKNRFHGGCLYKWFNTSHSSSCPLCRSDMF
ncbi:uncharacterized protein BT62DRAFT_937246 [Guyanagaster necrorhizus]|uniref:E3 ubiquitin-protein ligase listerin n=1 Tax=Guyanagaster necrorhizus TaxID=856835 RepID=A0A9P7VHV1_9AGAR|nr:uncharacterized protein BT62DRAFT_937246 [Guyanagaster necrorhizus MCA 3950]KAG7441328.1 hypothetical protein BT62DRAFT_937246 [Guyanagaster necrorhizus MCA 3950]